MLPELAKAQGRTSELQCPGCKGRLSTVPLKGADIRVCLACAVSVLAPGQLDALLAGTPPPPSSLSGANLVAPGPDAPPVPVAAADGLGAPAVARAPDAEEDDRSASGFRGVQQRVTSVFESLGAAKLLVGAAVLVGLWLVTSGGEAGDESDDGADSMDHAQYDAKEGLRGAVTRIPVFLPAEVTGRQKWDRVELSSEGISNGTKGYRWTLRFSGDPAAVEAFYDGELGCGAETRTRGQEYSCRVGTKTVWGGNTNELEYEFASPEAPSVNVEVELDPDDRELVIYENVPATKAAAP